MIKRFNDIKVSYIPDTTVEINNKSYLIHKVIEGEDILVDTDGKYPTLKEVVKKSPYRINYNPNDCGGCNFEHVTYDYEVELKKKYLNDLFKNFHLKNIDFIEAKDYLNYRNKTIMTYKLSKAKRVVCGLYEEYSHDILPTTNNILQSKKSNEIIVKLNEILTKYKIKPYDEKTNDGILKHVLVRYGFNSKEIMLVLVTNGEILPARNNILKDIKNLNLGITTIIQNFNPRKTNVVLGERQKILDGPGFIYENIGDYKFKISPQSFFQINTAGIETLYNTAIKKAGLTKNDLVIDAYCGVGTISIFASKYAKKVIGVELNKNAVNDAKINAKINNINNVEFICDDATNYITNLAKYKNKVDAVIMDPPREGSTKAFINAISYLETKKVIYISCNPETLKRDLYMFFDNDYVLESITGVDMFPRTVHTECIAVLKKDDELASLEKLAKISKNGGNVLEELSKKNRTDSNKMRVIPKADIEMMREDQYEKTGKIQNKKYKKY